jgi:competence protein ComEC
VSLGAGIALYFALPAEPAPATGPFFLLLALGLRAFARESLLPRILAVMLLSGALGFTAAQFRTAWVSAPVLVEELRLSPLTGRVMEVETQESGYRMLLSDLAAPGHDGELPEQARVTVRLREAARPPLGAVISLSAVLRPPPPPVAPGAYDFRRELFFRGIGAVGYATSSPEVQALPELSAVSLGLGRLRQTLEDRIAAHLQGAERGLAVALLTGRRGAIPAAVTEDMRRSGLAHLLAISGLHIGLVAGLAFFSLRLFMAAIPGLALHKPIKKYAAAGALAVVLAYMLLVGAPVPTQRAALMTGLVLLAVMLDRSAISLRLVAIAAAAVLLLRPESLLGPSFQMSFAAVTALIAAYDAATRRLPEWWHLDMDWWPRRMLVYCLSLAFSSLVASLATAPFALYHFHRIALYGVAANMLAVPLTALWVMPWGLLALFLAPIGLEGLALAPMGWGLLYLAKIADAFSALPGAVLYLPAAPPVGFVLMALGGLWLCIWRRGWRRGGLVPIAGGLALALIPQPRPAALVEASGGLFAVRLEDGDLALSEPRRNAFAAENWLAADGRAPGGASIWPKGEGALGNRLACGTELCVYSLEGRRLGFFRAMRPTPESCDGLDLAISPYYLHRRNCPGAGRIIDRRTLAREGALAVYGDGRVVSVADVSGNRPWSRAQ